MQNRNIAYLKSLIKYCGDIETIHQSFGSDYATYEENMGYQYSISFCVEQIGELAKKLRDNNITEAYPEIPWNKIAGLRNRIAHGYDSIDLEMVFDISVDEIPELLVYCRKILQCEEEKYED